MYELIRLAEHTYYMDCPAKVGFYRVEDDRVVLVDSGSDKDAAKKVKRILDEQGWTLQAIFNTHSHADHIGGNAYLQGLTGCPIYAPGAERCLTEYPVLEPVSLYGGYPLDGLTNKFLMAKPSAVLPLTSAVLPRGLEVIPLPGHSLDMVGFRSCDDVVFLADSLSGEDTLQKYGIGYLHDVQAYLDTLETIQRMDAACFVPSHAPVTEDIRPLAQFNARQTIRIAETIRNLLTEPKTFDELLGAVFDTYGLALSLQQYALVGSTVRSYLSYLEHARQIGYFFENNRMLWQVTD